MGCYVVVVVVVWSTKLGLKRPFTNITVESVRGYVVGPVEEFRVSVTVEGVNNCLTERLYQHCC
jgi:hypothetical protein